MYEKRPGQRRVHNLRNLRGWRGQGRDSMGRFCSYRNKTGRFCPLAHEQMEDIRAEKVRVFDEYAETYAKEYADEYVKLRNKTNNPENEQVEKFIDDNGTTHWFNAIDDICIGNMITFVYNNGPHSGNRRCVLVFKIDDLHIYCYDVDCKEYRTFSKKHIAQLFIINPNTNNQPTSSDINSDINSDIKNLQYQMDDVQDKINHLRTKRNI